MPDTEHVHDSPLIVSIIPNDGPILSNAPLFRISDENLQITDLTMGQAISLIKSITSLMEVAIYG